MAEACTACWHAHEHGWWGPSIPSGYTHCKDCHETFSAGCIHCLSCHRTFGSVRGLELHQRGPQHVCTDPAELVRKSDGAPLFKYATTAHGGAWVRLAAPSQAA